MKKMKVHHSSHHEYINLTNTDKQEHNINKKSNTLSLKQAKTHSPSARKAHPKSWGFHKMGPLPETATTTILVLMS